MPKNCEHDRFKSLVRVSRLTDTEGGSVTGYIADICIECLECGLPFRFLGSQYGSSPHQPMLSADGLELRAPIEPAHVTEILGRPLVAGTG
jgi:hypothetical protein